MSGQAAQGGERNVRFQRRYARKKTSIVINGRSKRGTEYPDRPLSLPTTAQRLEQINLPINKFDPGG
ncbi:hypothetical protein AA12717_2119 [Gluconacetobacter sacchari DSM 12717]|uniref:Uncharacterized protein n=1 Tax=Gluconacetobacter sacchari DSM 12717 TaxID=1307940 RepID=A0ABQ0P7Y4_9PROT|nr:hypothetical protein AA12717_2119 [Gluconacetobacter sacchari DSM 12717]